MKEQKQQEIFHDWLKKYHALFMKVVYSFARESALQDDLFQEIAVQVWKSIPAFRGESSAVTWLYRVALNTAVKWSASEKKFRDLKNSIENEPPVFLEPIRIEDERLDWLYNEISKLEEVDRSIALLLLDGLSYRDIAEIIGISEGNIGVKIHRIKKHLIKRSTKMKSHGI